MGAQGACGRRMCRRPFQQPWSEHGHHSTDGPCLGPASAYRAAQLTIGFLPNLPVIWQGGQTQCRAWTTHISPQAPPSGIMLCLGEAIWLHGYGHPDALDHSASHRPPFPPGCRGILLPFSLYQTAPKCLMPWAAAAASGWVSLVCLHLKKSSLGFHLL